MVETRGRLLRDGVLNGAFFRSIFVKGGAKVVGTMLVGMVVVVVFGVVVVVRGNGTFFASTTTGLVPANSASSLKFLE